MKQGKKSAPSKKQGKKTRVKQQGKHHEESHKHSKQKATSKHVHNRGRERWTERTDPEEMCSSRKNQVNSKYFLKNLKKVEEEEERKK